MTDARLVADQHDLVLLEAGIAYRDAGCAITEARKTARDARRLLAAATHT